jgi:hypothetical protein
VIVPDVLNSLPADVQTMIRATEENLQYIATQLAMTPEQAVAVKQSFHMRFGVLSSRFGLSERPRCGVCRNRIIE